jgi:predicted NBD/HSP70 family sugar kinase
VANPGRGSSWTFGAARDQDDVIVVSLGAVVGLGVLAGSRLSRGATNSAGPLVSAIIPVIEEYALATAFEAATAVLGRHLDHPVSLGTDVLAFEAHLLD